MMQNKNIQGELVMDELLGNYIKVLRDAKNFMQEQVAEQIGVSRQMLQKLQMKRLQLNIKLSQEELFLKRYLLTVAEYSEINLGEIIPLVWKK